MTSFSTSFKLSACALAASVLISACGGGAESTDKVPPTVAITAAAGASGTAVFTFTFSEDVGNSFVAEDIAVTGGTAGSLVRVDATHYTMTVTGSNGSTGSIAVSVAATKFKDVALNDNVAAAEASHTLGVTTLATFDETVAPAINAFGGTVISVDAGPSGGSGKALKIVRNGGEPWAGTWVAVPAIQSTAGAVTVSARVYSPTAGIKMVAKAEYAENAGSGDTQASTTVVQGWQTLSWNFTNLDSSKVYNRFVLIPNLGNVDTDKTYYLDDITASVGSQGGGAASCGTTEPTCAPTTVVASDAVKIYTESAAAAGFNARPDWGQSVTQSEVTIAGNKSLKYGFSGGGFGAVGAYEGLQWDAVNVSGKGKLHLDLWSADMSSVKISLIGGGKENAITQAVTAGSWNSVDIDLSTFTADKTAVIQIKLESATAGTLYVDNIHFWGAPTAGGGGATPNPTAAAGSAGPVTIPVLTAADTMGFAGVGDAVFAGDYIGTLDSNNKRAKWDSATTNGVASNGNIGYFQDTALSTSAQKLEENGWVAGLIDNPPGVPSFFRYFILKTPASAFASSYMGLYANAPNNGTVDVSTYGNIKFRAWGPAEMYQNANFNPTLEITLAGAKVAGCTATGSGGTEIKKTFSATQKIGAASTYKLPLAAWTVTGVCGSDTNATAVSAVLKALAQVVVTVPGSSFNFTNINTDNQTYTTGLNLGPIAFTNN